MNTLAWIVLGGVLMSAIAGMFLIDIRLGIVSWLIPFAAGNFIYIGASDLVPEVNKHSDLKGDATNLLALVLGIALLLLAKTELLL